MMVLKQSVGSNTSKEQSLYEKSIEPLLFDKNIRNTSLLALRTSDLLFINQTINQYLCLFRLLLTPFIGRILRFLQA